MFKTNSRGKLPENTGDRELILNLPQAEFMDNDYPCNWFVAGRGTGKSTLGGLVAADGLWKGQNIVGCAQNFKALKSGLIASTRKMLDMMGTQYDYNKQDFEITIRETGATFTGISAANSPDSGRGFSQIERIVFDEIAYTSEDFFISTLPICRCNKNGVPTVPKIYGLTSPKGGSNWFNRHLRKPEVMRMSHIVRASMLDNVRNLGYDYIQTITANLGYGTNIYRQEVLGEILEVDPVDVLIPAETINAAVSNSFIESRGTQVVIGVDFARFGDDNTVICARLGYQARFMSLSHANTDDIYSAIVSFENLYGKDNISAYNLDGTGGYASGVYDRLVQDKSRNNVRELNFGANPPLSEERSVANLRAYIFKRLKKWIYAGGRIPDEDTATEIKAIRYFINTKQQFAIIPKEIIKRDLQGDSPDRADALALSCYDPNPSAEFINANIIETLTNQKDRAKSLMNKFNKASAW